MTVPTAPTLATIVSEGLTKAGETSPTSALTTRAQGQYMEEIKNDIWRKTKVLKSLQGWNVVILSKGISRYSMPSDYAGQGEIAMKILDGSETGTAQTGGNTSITLAANEDVTEDYIIGKYILITAGTGAGSYSQVSAYDTSTKIATVSHAWSTNPAASSTYLIVGSEIPIDQNPIWDLDKSYIFPSRQRPLEFHPIGDQDYSEFILNPAPDKTYGAFVRYSLNIMTVDLSSTLLSTLYQKWRNVFIYGVFAKHLESEDDGRAPRESQRYYNMLSDMIANETYGTDIHSLQARVSD